MVIMSRLNQNIIGICQNLTYNFVSMFYINGCKKAQGNQEADGDCLLAGGDVQRQVVSLLDCIVICDVTELLLVAMVMVA